MLMTLALEIDSFGGKFYCCTMVGLREETGPLAHSPC